MRDEETVRLVDLVWGPVKKRNLASPVLGDATWHDILVVAEETVEDALRRALTSPVQGERARIGRRCVINDAVRKATVYPVQYSVPLYVSEGFLTEVAAAEDRLAPAAASSKRRRSVRMPKCCVEHVVPIAVHCSGSRIIADPEANLRYLRRTLLGPVCLLTKEEDRRIDPALRKRNDRPNRPFGRYEGITEIRRTDTGERIDREGFSFRDHLRVMASHPAYATAVPMFNGAAAAWRDRIAQIRQCRDDRVHTRFDPCTLPQAMQRPIGTNPSAEPQGPLFRDQGHDTCAIAPEDAKRKQWPLCMIA